MPADTQVNMGGGEQYNARRDININNTAMLPQVADKLKALQAEVKRAQQQGELPEAIANHVQQQVDKAVQQANAPRPDQRSISDHVTTAKTLLDGVETATKLVTGLMNVLQMVQGRF